MIVTSVCLRWGSSALSHMGTYIFFMGGQISGSPALCVFCFYFCVLYVISCLLVLPSGFALKWSVQLFRLSETRCNFNFNCPYDIAKFTEYVVVLHPLCFLKILLPAKHGRYKFPISEKGITPDNDDDGDYKTLRNLQMT